MGAWTPFGRLLELLFGLVAWASFGRPSFFNQLLFGLGAWAPFGRLLAPFGLVAWTFFRAPMLFLNQLLLGWALGLLAGGCLGLFWGWLFDLLLGLVA